MNRRKHLNFNANEEVSVSRVLTGLSLAALICLAGISIKSWQSGHHRHAIVLGLFFGLVVVNLVSYWITRNRARNKTGMLFIVGGLFVYLVASGGESNTGPLWLYVFPPLVFYLTSLRIGTILLAACLAFTLLVFQFPQLPFVLAHYETNFQLRFFTTMLFESVFCFVLETSRLNARNELMRLAASHEQAARTDALTGLPNRRDMQLQLANEFSRYQRSGHHFSVVLIDLDHFKQINDTYGHDVGDLVLQAFAELMQNICRQSDRPCRWGGEEFLILLPDTSLLQALTLSERLRYEVEQHGFIHKSQRLPVSISAGVCSISQSDSIDHLLRQADKNLYDAKESGRNRISPRVRTPSTRSPASS
ncbi:GGDEF domain-containing protein [Marinobacter halodurans]|uniref:diguanylate cyclase n=1 Tax=Marinobacter halodurans TaxID=2528979 RepID=A0ABY1ZSL1_9GAMM|nr:GGDEF domain-containing protein [Marinobacter halodurans]TBW58810.1 GGDEF domain-containing protein [Marinobacter halodurans]